MNNLRTKISLAPTTQSGRRDRVGAPTGVLGTAHWWMLGTGAPLAACASDDDSSSAVVTPPAPVTPPKTNDPVSSIIPFKDATVVGNNTTIELDGAFESGYTIIGASDGIIGSDKLLTISDAEFPEGTNNITVTATDAGGSTVTQTIELVSDKTPTIATGLADAIAGTSATVIDLAGVFGGGSVSSVALTLEASFGTIGDDNKFSISEAELTDPTYTLTITATDADGDAVKEIVEIVTGTALIVANTLQDATVAGNNTIVDLTSVFDNSGGSLTLVASRGTIADNMLTLSDADFPEGTHAITITATDAGGNALEETFELVSDKTPTIANTVADATVAGNDTIIDLDMVFDNGSGELTLTTTLGTIDDDKLTLSDAVFTDGTHTITITATDTDNDAVEETVVLVSDKTPTIATIVADESITGNIGTTIDISKAFSGGSGDLTLTASDGTVSDEMLTLLGSDLVDGTNTITLTATDSDTTDKDSVTSTFVINANKSPTVVTAINNETVAGNGGTIIDLNGVFGNAGGALTLAASAGALGSNNSLTFAGTELVDGANTFTVTATDADSETVTDEFVITTTKVLTILDDAAATVYGATQHATQTFNLARVFGIPASTNLAFTALSGISQDMSAPTTLTFDNSTLGVGTHSITITATEGSDTLTHTLTYTLDTIKAQSGDGLNTTYNGTTLADMITDNSFATTGTSVLNIVLNGGAGNDTINSNTLTAKDNVFYITFDGGDGNDTISNNTLTAGNDVHTIRFDGRAGDDTISNNILTAEDDDVEKITFDGGAGDDTINSNTLTGDDDVEKITFDGGAGDDTISDNHLELTGTGSDNGVFDVSFMGGAGDDVFSGNTATQANGSRSSITIDGGVGTDAVHFELASGMFTITGAYGSNITVTDKAARTGDIESYAEYVLIDIEELYFADSDMAYEFGGGG